MPRFRDFPRLHAESTLGHTNATVAEPRFLDLVTRGLRWAGDKLSDDGSPAAGYGPPRS